MTDVNAIDQIIGKHGNKQEAIIPILQDIQEQRGYLPREDLEEVARKTGLSLNKIYGVATFYSQFSMKPRGQFIISVCTGTACHVKGSDKLLVYLEQKLGIKAGEVTQDGKFGLGDLRCIGACSLAPAIMINSKVYGNMTNAKIDEVLKTLE